MATNQHLCTYLFDRKQHYTLQNIADINSASTKAVEGFYLQLKDAGLLRLWTTEGYKQKAKDNGWSKYIDMHPTVETLAELLTKATAAGIDLDAEVPPRT